MIPEISLDFRSSRLLDFKHWIASVSPAENSAWSLFITSERVLIFLSFDNFYSLNIGPGSSVGIATDYGLDGPGSNPGWDEIFRPLRPALGPTQPPVKWVPGLSRG